jgi:hypothetical protein
MTHQEDDRTRVLGGDDATVVLSAPGPLPPPSAGRSDESGVLPAGDRLGEFEITKLIGQGGFGVVYEAWDHTLDRAIALKEYLPSALASRQGGTVAPRSEKHRETFELGMRSFINEAKLLAQFDHPSLLKVYRFWEAHGTAYMAMPLYRGQTLRDTLAALPEGADEDWLLRIMDGVTQALAVMHAAQCYHRDIAPDNILLLESSGRPVVLDFGAARRVISDATQAITVILKPGYAPVEQYAEIPDMHQGAWTDVYALAAVMHVAVCGKSPPPSVARLVSDAYQPLADNPALRQRYSEQLLRAIDQGLTVRPEARPQSMAELRAALGLEPHAATAELPTRAMAPRSAAATTLTRRPTTAPAAARKPAWPLAAAGVVALAAVGGGGWWWLHGRAAPPAPASAPVVASAPVAPVAAPAPAAAAPPTPVAPPPPPRAARTPLESLAALGEGATPGFGVTATPGKTTVAVGKDQLNFQVRSQRDGYVYVFLLSSNGDLVMLFPNLLDKYNKITANTALSLPRASWPMNAGGPPGTDHFAVLVSGRERDFSGAGIQNDGVFPQFSLPTLASLEAASAGSPTPLLGKPICPGDAPCTDTYGVADFQIVEK